MAGERNRETTSVGEESRMDRNDPSWEVGRRGAVLDSVVVVVGVGVGRRKKKRER